MTLKGKREKGTASATPPLGEAIKSALEKAKASLSPLVERVQPYWHSLPKLHRTAISVLGALLVVLLIWPSSEDSLPETNTAGERVSVPLAVGQQEASNDEGFDADGEQVIATQTVGAQTVNTDWVNYEVKGGDTLSNIFRAQDLPLPDLYAISAIEGDDKPLSRIQPGQLLHFKRNDQGTLDMLQIETSGASVIFFRLSDGSFVRRK
ncbi:LysM-like peptidoglycan-binding domain-containing protein [Grimontia marina]|uniref:Opacity-associated protein A LysM-like domain protein n=1 Tax=Grimontia marina TaxID=646534 RepID=A0A128FB40_9GAMM|nr:LysM-like peptidoglycan-binding domain-containing protein [Grimontia marina]CZF83554.1 Opacity-associated protein A LysM-like domain protein [Grimontia marina]